MGGSDGRILSKRKRQGVKMNWAGREIKGLPNIIEW